MIPLNQFMVADRNQVRQRGLNDDRVDSYAQSMLNGDVFPPVIVYCNDSGKYVLMDGFHRYWAAKQNEYTELAAIVYPDRPTAQIAAWEAQLKHGLELTTPDKKQIFIDRAYDGDWSGLSTRFIARKLSVSHATLINWEREIYQSSGRQRQVVRQTAQGTTMNTQNIGQQNPPYIKPILSRETLSNYSANMRSKLNTLIKLGELTQELVESHRFEEVHNNPFSLCVRDVVTGKEYGRTKPRPADQITAENKAADQAVWQMERAELKKLSSSKSAQLCEAEQALCEAESRLTRSKGKIHRFIPNYK